MVQVQILVHINVNRQVQVYLLLQVTGMVVL